MKSEDKRMILIGLAIGVALVFLGMVVFRTADESVKAPRNEDGAFVGVVTRVWEDGMRMSVEERSIRFDTWSVCGDRTARNISVDDALVVYADRDFLGYEAWRILNVEGNSVCR